MFRGVSYLAARALRRHITGPLRLRRFELQQAPVVVRSRFGIELELHPGEYVDRAIVMDGAYEDRFLEWIISRLSGEAVVLDIGANIGNHALFLSRHVAAVHCFEPNPRAWRRLERNVALNNAHNVVVHRFGLGDSDATATFFENIGGNLGASGFVAADGPTREVQLPIRRAGMAIESLHLHRIDLVKIDVEGMEEQVISGLRHTLEKDRPMIAFEYHGETLGPEGLERIRALLPPVYRIMEPRFSPHRASLIERARWNVANAGRPELVEVETPETRWYENLIGLPHDDRHP